MHDCLRDSGVGRDWCTKAAPRSARRRTAVPSSSCVLVCRRPSAEPPATARCLRMASALLCLSKMLLTLCIAVTMQSVTAATHSRTAQKGLKGVHTFAVLSQERQEQVLAQPGRDSSDWRSRAPSIAVAQRDGRRQPQTRSGGRLSERAGETSEPPVRGRRSV